jgi:hypothetical protein
MNGVERKLATVQGTKEQINHSYSAARGQYKCRSDLSMGEAAVGTLTRPAVTLSLGDVHNDRGCSNVLHAQVNLTVPSLDSPDGRDACKGKSLGQLPYRTCRV